MGFWKLQSLLLLSALGTATVLKRSIATFWGLRWPTRTILPPFSHRRNHVAHSTVANFSPHEHTILGFCVPDVRSTVGALRDRGVTFNFYPHFPQDELGIFVVPGEIARVAWFCDPDGNVLSVMNP